MSRVEFWVSGVQDDASGLTSVTKQMRCGIPVRRAIIEVTSENRVQLIHEAERWLRDGLAHCQVPLAGC